MRRDKVQPRRLNDSARFSFILWSRLCNWKEGLVIVKPETLIGWHRKDCKLFWKRESQAGRPRIPENIRELIKGSWTAGATHVCNETRELGEELVGPYRYQVHFLHWPESNNYGVFFSDKRSIYKG